MQQSTWPSFIDNSLLEKSTDNSKQLQSSNKERSQQDLFTEKDGLCFAGIHIILDCWGASHLDDLDHIEKALRDAIDIAGATLLHIHLHHFTPNAGVSGVAVLAESHISIHTWPERDYAALDIFMCGDTQPEKAIAVFKEAFQASNITITKHLRGVVPTSVTKSAKNSSSTTD